MKPQPLSLLVTAALSALSQGSGMLSSAAPPGYVSESGFGLVHVVKYRPLCDLAALKQLMT